MPALVSNSFSKIFSLYGERIGGLSVLCEDAETASRVLGQLKATVRRNFSSPANFGAQVVGRVLNDVALNGQWRGEVEAMRSRIDAMRQVLVAALRQALPERNFDFLLTQRGMFSYTGFSAAQVERLREEFGVYLPSPVAASAWPVSTTAMSSASLLPSRLFSKTLPTRRICGGSVVL